jgi:hypothetical protein
MTEILKTEKDCTRCGCLSICDAHVTGGTWKHREGKNPCRFRPEITEVPIQPACAPVIDADEQQKNRFSLREDK